MWWEADPRDEAGMWWGQLAGGTHRLMSAVEHLSKLPGRRKTDDALNELGYHLENYFTRTYELRERAVGLMGKILGRRFGAAKIPGRRAALAATIPERFQGASMPFFSLLDLLDYESEIRNKHTHAQFLSIVLATRDDFFDPADALMDTERGEFSRPLNSQLRREVARLSKEYGDRARNIIRMTWKVLETTQRLL